MRGDAVSKAEVGDLLAGVVEALPEFACDGEADVGAGGAGECVDRDVEAFVGADEAEEEELQGGFAGEGAGGVGDVVEGGVREYAGGGCRGSGWRGCRRWRSCGSRSGRRRRVCQRLSRAFQPEPSWSKALWTMVAQGMPERRRLRATVAEGGGEEEGPGGEDREVGLPGADRAGGTSPGEGVHAVEGPARFEAIWRPPCQARVRLRRGRAAAGTGGGRTRGGGRCHRVFASAEATAAVCRATPLRMGGTGPMTARRFCPARLVLAL